MTGSTTHNDNGNSDQQLVALLDVLTIQVPPVSGNQLQSTFVDNFTNYRPFVNRQLVNAQRQLDDDDETIDGDLNDVNSVEIMGQLVAAFNRKLDLLVVEEILKPSSLCFANEDHFNQFKHGHAQPLFKVLAPFLSQMRPTTPFIIIKRGSDHEPYCTIYTKQMSRVRRLVFQFTPHDAPMFELVAFINHYRPFTDFNYKNTRFRVFGTPVTLGYILGHKILLKLTVVDNGKPSLCDNMREKEGGKLIKRKESNYVPDPDNPLITEDVYSTYRENMGTSFVNESMPPFGALEQTEHTTASVRLPKKYSEVATLELYQSQPGPDETYGLNGDSVVLTAVLLGLREVTVRMSYKIPQQDTSILRPDPGNLFIATM